MDWDQWSVADLLANRSHLLGGQQWTVPRSGPIRELNDTAHSEQLFLGQRRLLARLSISTEELPTGWVLPRRASLRLWPECGSLHEGQASQWQRRLLGVGRNLLFE